MKRLIPTIVLLVLCIGGFWYASSKNFFKEKPPEAAAVVAVKKEEVASYTIKKESGVTELQQKDGKWTMTQPAPLPLNGYSPASWVDSLNGATKEKTVNANPSDLAQFGLDKPKQEFTVTLTNGTTHKLMIGNALPVPGFSYAKVDNSPEVFQLSDDKVKSLAKEPIDFMEKSPFTIHYEEIRSLTVDWKGKKWILTKNDPAKASYESNWKVGDKEIKGSDASGILDKAAFISSNEMVKRVAEVKLDAPELRVEMKDVGKDNKETTTVYVGKIDGDNVWIAKQGGDWAYTIPAATVQELYDKANDVVAAAQNNASNNAQTK